MKNVLVIGGGGREHAIIMKLAESKQVDKIVLNLQGHEQTFSLALQVDQT